MQGFLDKDEDGEDGGEEENKAGQVGQLLSPLIKIVDKVRKTTSMKQTIIIGTQVRA